MTRILKLVWYLIGRYCTVQSERHYRRFQRVSVAPQKSDVRTRRFFARSASQASQRHFHRHMIYAEKARKYFSKVGVS